MLASAAVAGSLPRGDAVPRLANAESQSDTDAKFQLIRAEDQLRLDVIYPHAGFEKVPEGGGYALRALGNQVIELVLAPQHVLEWDVSPPARPSRPVHAAQTRLRFRVPAGTKIPLSTAGVLAAVRDLALSAHIVTDPVAKADVPSSQADFVSAADLLRDEAAYLRDGRLRRAALLGEVAVGASDDARSAQDDAGSPFDPGTSLAISSRLIISPPGGETRFSHATEPVRHGAPWAEIWHTRLTVRTVDGGRVEIPVLTRATAVQAVRMAPDMDDASLSGLTKEDAEAIVAQNTMLGYPSIWSDIAIRMTKLHLSPRLGATTRLNGNWSALASPAVASFAHTLSGGRDVYHRIAVAGRLYPLGHAAVRTETVERVFDSNGASGMPAVLRKKTRIAVKKSLMHYSSHLFPFKSVEILVDTTPNGTTHAIAAGEGYLEVDGDTYEYECRGVDHANRPVDFSMPLVFVPDTFPDESYPTLVSNYSGNAIAWVDLGRVNVAEPAPGSSPGATEVFGQAKFRATIDDNLIVPTVTSFFGRLPALGHLADQAGSMVINYAGRYKSYVFDPGTAAAPKNPGEVVLELGSAVPVRATEAAGAGGLFNTLDLAISGTSRKLGTVAGDLAEVAVNSFDPVKFLGDAVLDQLTLFGLFPLRQLIPASGGLDRAPTTTARTIDGLREQKFHWQVPLFLDLPPLSVSGARLEPQLHGEPYLTVDSVVTIGLDGQPHQRTTCRINDVQVTFGLGGADLILLPINHIEFVSEGTQKPSVDVAIGEIEFFGVLGFVSRLASLIGGNGFGGARALAGRASAAKAAQPNGPALDVSSYGVRASYALAIPTDGAARHPSPALGHLLPGVRLSPAGKRKEHPHGYI